MVGAHLVPIKVCLFCFTRGVKNWNTYCLFDKNWTPKNSGLWTKKQPLRNSASKKYAQNNQGTSTFFNQTSIFSGFESLVFRWWKSPSKRISSDSQLSFSWGQKHFMPQLCPEISAFSAMKESWLEPPTGSKLHPFLGWGVFFITNPQVSLKWNLRLIFTYFPRRTEHGTWKKKSGNSPSNLQHPSSNFFLGGVQHFFFSGMRKNTKLDSNFPSKSCFSPGVEQFSRQCVADDFEVAGEKAVTVHHPGYLQYAYIYIYVYTIYIFTEREGVHEKLSLMFSYTTSYRNNIYIYIHTWYVYIPTWVIYMYIYLCYLYHPVNVWKLKDKICRERTTVHLQAVQLSTGAWLTASQLGEATSWENCWLVEGFLRIPKPWRIHLVNL